jgi:cytoskeletal protein RodZ
MKTVGQIIRAARQQRSFSVEQLSHLTKIDAKYIGALESDRYSDLPSETFAKGFIRNLSQRLGLNPDELVAIYRRDYRQPDRARKTRSHPKISIPGISSQVLPFFLGGIVFIIYLIFQFRAILTPPKLEISRPASASVLVSPIEIEGNTAIDATVYVNEDTQVKPDSTGHFLARINLPVGQTILEIKSVNRFSRTSSQNISVTIISK